VDIRLFARVFSRFKFLVAGGFILALLLSILTVAKLPSLAPRVAPKYASTATLFVTQPGSPFVRATQPYTTDPNGGPVAVGDMNRLTALANLYVQLANSDVIRSRVTHMSPLRGTVAASQNYSYSPQLYSTALPMLTITGTSDSPRNARALTQVGVAALKGYIEQQQRAASVANANRVVVQEVQRPNATIVVNPIKKTLPIVVFITVMLAVTGLAFALENLRPRPAVANTSGQAPTLTQQRARRSA
jgi:hypothetical protein